MKFADLGLDPKVLTAVQNAGYETPTPIQAQAIPEALQGRDILGIAQTGTGKTASFTLPMICLLAKGRARARMPRSLILAPTRELAAQVAENFDTYGQNQSLTMALLIGGVSFAEQDKLIDRGVDVLIATPGRLLDHFERGKLMLTGIEIMVVDEADRMLDMGFIEDLERIFKLTPFTRQTLFFSATMPPEITRLTQEFLSNPVRIEVARQATTAETVEQRLCMLANLRRDQVERQKRAALRAIINQQGEKLTNGIIFCNRKRDVGVLYKSLTSHGYNVGALHGDLDQRVRMQVLDSFRKSEVTLLVASDVAARGLDIPQVSHVFNFDVPHHAEDYVHRIGRTGRAGREGVAVTLAVGGDDKAVEKIEQLIGKPIPRVDPPETERVAEEPRRRERRKDANDEREKSRESKSSGGRNSDSKNADSKNVEAKGGEGRRSDQRSDNPRRRRGRGRNDDDGGNQVVGMGDHVPAFLMRDVPLPTRKKAAEDATRESDQDIEAKAGSEASSLDAA